MICKLSPDSLICFNYLIQLSASTVNCSFQKLTVNFKCQQQMLAICLILLAGHVTVLHYTQFVKDPELNIQ